MQKSFLIFLVFLIGSTSIIAQELHTLKGEIVSSHENYKLIGAKIFFVEDPESTTADIDGAFKLVSNKPFPWNLKIEYIGYIEYNLIIHNVDTFQIIKMEEDIKANDKVIITPLINKPEIPKNPLYTKNCWKRY